MEKNLTVALHAVVPANHPKRAVFNITAVSSYKCYLNGLFIGYGPSISAHGFHRFDAYDLTSKLKNGTNILTVEVAGYNVDNYHIPNQPSFVQAELRIDGKVVAATMTGNKKEAFAFYLPQQRQQDVPKLSFQRPHMEAYVLGKDPHMWRNSTHPTFTRQEVEETDRKKILPRGVAYPDYSLLTAKRMGEQPYFAFEHNATGFIKTTIVVGSPSKLKLYWDEILEEGVIKKGRLGYNTYVTYQLQPGTYELETFEPYTDRKSTRLNSSHIPLSRMPSSA